jgi:rhodanese-related sulfurtransferase
MSFRLKLAAAFFVAGSMLAGSIAVAQTPAPAAPAVPSYPPSVSELVAKTKSQIKVMKLEEFKSANDRKDVGLLVDVREEDEWVDGYVPGAINIPRGLIEFRIWKSVGFPTNTDLAAKITLYCATGGRCALAAKSLQDLGFSNVASVDMLFANWVKAGYPVVKPK